MRLSVIAMACCGSLACAGSSLGDSIANLTVDSGSSANVQIRLEVDVAVVGSGNDTASRNVGVSGSAGAILKDGKPFAGIDIDQLSLDLSNTNFSYEFFCVPFFGCAVSGELAVANFNLGISETLSASIGSGGQVVFNEALFNPSFDFNVDISGVVSESLSGEFSDIATQTFSCRVDAARGVAFLDGFGIDTIIFDVDPATLPSGVNSVRIIANVDLGGVSMTGAYIAQNPADFDGNGIVDAADLGLLFAAWGTATCDLNGDGTTDSADVGLLIAAWSV